MKFHLHFQCRNEEFLLGMQPTGEFARTIYCAVPLHYDIMFQAYNSKRKFQTKWSVKSNDLQCHFKQ